MIQTVMLRSLLQAVYGPDSKMGHFGLALQDYAHFTSPIRRYPDLLVHRGIRHVLQTANKTPFSYDLNAMTALGETCSQYERRADLATRDAGDWLKCEFLQKHVGKQYRGIVTTVTSFGMFVQINDLLIDGLVHVTSLKRDYYRFDAAHHRLVGEKTGRVYQLGDSVTVEVARVDMEERKIDFDIISSEAAHFVAGDSDAVEAKPRAKNSRSRKGSKDKPAADKPAQKQKKPRNKPVAKKKVAKKKAARRPSKRKAPAEKS